MEWLYLIIILVMAAGLISTILVGRSASNKVEDPRYSQQTGRKWLRLGIIYIAGIIIVAALLIWL
ncbi:hypothetical protein D3P09_07230 [Paenibacillus pinisoli]|uniref:Uncharacterized protein n=1 Tax=Paenibacillus pinisoli TaxID=1276110 RepID=A0A3A6PY14_9BACL|nr:hypothetical protein [Paenibacillus pinisoli]RJX41731.1 hypothetical protein D3P09_07230 [Paenibacillus pinisoli]